VDICTKKSQEPRREKGKGKREKKEAFNLADLPKRKDFSYGFRQGNPQIVFPSLSKEKLHHLRNGGISSKCDGRIGYEA